MKEYHFTVVRTEKDYITITAKNREDADKKLDEQDYDSIGTKVLERTTDLESVDDIEEESEDDL